VTDAPARVRRRTISKGLGCGGSGVFAAGPACTERSHRTPDRRTRRPRLVSNSMPCFGGATVNTPACVAGTAAATAELTTTPLPPPARHARTNALLHQDEGGAQVEGRRCTSEERSSCPRSRRTCRHRQPTGVVDQRSTRPRFAANRARRRASARLASVTNSAFPPSFWICWHHLGAPRAAGALNYYLIRRADRVGVLNRPAMTGGGPRLPGRSSLSSVVIVPAPPRKCCGCPCANSAARVYLIQRANDAWRLLIGYQRGWQPTGYRLGRLWSYGNSALRWRS